MHKTVPMYMTTLSNTLVYTCEWVFLFCFTLLYCKCFFPCVLCCLIFIDVLHIQMQLMQRLDLWNEFVRVYVCMYVCMNVLAPPPPCRWVLISTVIQFTFGLFSGTGTSIFEDTSNLKARQITAFMNPCRKVRMV